MFGPLDKVYRITVAETVTLSPSMVADIPCLIEGVSGQEEFVGVVEPRSKFSERYSAGALRTAVTVKDGRIPVRVFNSLDKPLKVYRCSSIGDLHPLVDEVFRKRKNVSTTRFCPLTPTAFQGGHGI